MHLINYFGPAGLLDHFSLSYRRMLYLFFVHACSSSRYYHRQLLASLILLSSFYYTSSSSSGKRTFGTKSLRMATGFSFLTAKCNNAAMNASLTKEQGKQFLTRNQSVCYVYLCMVVQLSDGLFPRLCLKIEY